MTLNYSTPAVNPRLGSGFSIFASTYLCLVLMLVILEQLGLAAQTIDQAIVVAPACFYIAIGFMTRTINLDDFFLSGQRVPPLYNALALSVSVFGGAIVLGAIGSFFFIGIDALAIPLGCFAGLILTAVLFVPWLRKAGARTLPGFFSLRFGKTSPRLLAALLLLPPCGMILIAEVALGARITSYFLPPPEALGFHIQSSPFFVILAFASIFLAVALGGVRSATWTQCAQFIVFLGILAPLLVVSVMRTNLPFPQVTYGSQLDEVRALESSKGIARKAVPAPLSLSLPKPGPAALNRPAEQPFSAFRPADFVLLVLCLAAGIAAHPALLTRLTTTPTILGTRRSFGWVAFIAGLIVLTIPAYALFTKAMVMAGLVGVSAPDLPAFGKTLEQLGLVSMPASQFGIPEAATPVLFHRDTVALLLPVAAGLPRVFLGLAAAAAIAALSACGAAQLVAIGNSISDDLYHGVLHKAASPSRRLLVARLSMLLFGLIVFAFCRDPNIDPLRLAIEAFSLSAGTFFAVLVLSVWWRRLTAAGAVAGMAAGFTVTTLYLLGMGGFTTATPLFGIDRLTAGAVGLPIGFAAAIVVSLARRPDAAALEAVDELRVPAGETLQARAVRLGSRGKPQRSG